MLEISALWKNSTMDKIVLKSWVSLLVIIFSKDSTLFASIFDSKKSLAKRPLQLWETLLGLPESKLVLAALFDLSKLVPEQSKLQASAVFVEYACTLLKTSIFPSLLFRAVLSLNADQELSFVVISNILEVLKLSSLLFVPKNF